MKSKKVLFIILLFIVAISVSACGKKEVAPVVEKPVPASVKGQKVSDSLSVKQSLNYPGVVSAENEAKIIAKASGNLTDVKFKVGDQVILGQELAKIDDVNSSAFISSNYNTNQIKQAKNSVSQAESSYLLAKSNYDNLLISSVKDLRAAEIARDQAAKGQSNLDITTSESVKSAELSYETSQIALEQARLSLENRRKQATQGSVDAKTNADSTANLVTMTSGGIITNINNITAFDDNNMVSIAYRSNLGALDSSSYDNAKKSYQKAKDEFVSYSNAKFNSVDDKVASAIKVVNAAKQLTDDVKILFDKTITSSYLPQTSPSGASLSGLQAAVSGYQAQIASSVSQINGASQSLANSDLNNSSSIDALSQAYELAKQQVASAKQNLENLKSGNSSQKDQAGFSYNLAQNQFDNLKIKIESQVMAAKTQMDTAQLQYNNAIVSLQSLYDSHTVISPLNGTVTKVYISNGEAVAAGSPILTVAQVKDVKVQFYIEPENLSYIQPGLVLKVSDSNNVSYDGVVSAVSPQADPITRRLLVEIKIINANNLLLGTIVDVNLEIIKKATESGTLIIPLAALNVGQNGNYIYVNDNNKAKKVEVEIKEVVGELAQIKVNLSPETMIITNGNKLLVEGQDISFTQ